MKKMRAAALGMAGVAAVALVIELAEPKAVHAVVATLVEVANVPNVNVVNTPTVRVASAAPVSVVGEVAVNSVPPVQVNGAVSVTNVTDSQGTHAVLVQNVNPQSVFDEEGTCTFSATDCGPTAVYTVPDNATAVVQSISGICLFRSNTSDQLAEVALSYTDAQALPVAVNVVPGPLIPVTLLQEGIQNYRANLTGVYVPAGSAIQANFGSVQPSDGSSCYFSVLGYLVEK